MRVIQISDLHLFADPTQKLLGLNTAESLRAVIDLIHQNETSESIHLIVLTGDLSQDNSPESYQHIVEAFKDFSCPIYWIPGNHDALDLMPKILNTQFKEDKAILCGNWQFIFLNSHYPKHIEGLLGRTELSRLDHYLKQHSDQHTLVFLHHPPVDINCKWLDPLKLKNSEDFFAITDRYANVRGIACGHIHQAFETERQGVPILSAPSTCIQFLPESDKFALDSVNPGYRWFELDPNGNFRTEVERVKNFVNTADAESKGY